MFQRRCREQIFLKILELCKTDGVSKTKIVYTCNLNFETAGKYLKTLIESGLLKIAFDHTIVYKTTSKGLGAIDHLKPFEDLNPFI